MNHLVFDAKSTSVDILLASFLRPYLCVFKRFEWFMLYYAPISIEC